MVKPSRSSEPGEVLAKYPHGGEPDFNDISFNVWVHSYCIAPDPARAIAAFSYFINSQLSNDDAIFWPVFYFFQCLFKDNPALAEKLAATFSSSTARLQEYTVFLLRAIRFKRSGKSPIPDSLWKRFDTVTDSDFYDPFAITFKIKSLRLMEFGFYYYGRYDMIRFLIECLGLNTRAGYELFLKHCKEYGTDCLRILDKTIAMQLHSEAEGILRKAYLKHQLITAYCNFALNDREVGGGSEKRARKNPSNAGEVAMTDCLA